MNATRSRTFNVNGGILPVSDAPSWLDFTAQAVTVLSGRFNTAPAHARAWMSETAAGWGAAPDPIEAAAIIVSELVTNAHKHTDSGRGLVALRMLVRRADRAVRIEVRDAGLPGGAPPALGATDAAALDEHGRGLFLVDALSDSWGAEPHAGWMSPQGVLSAGTTVWSHPTGLYAA